VHRPEDGDVVFVDLVAVAPLAGHIHIDGALEGRVFVAVVGIDQGAEKGGLVAFGLTGGKIAVEIMGLFDVGDGMAEEAGDPVAMTHVPGIGLRRSRDEIRQVFRRRHVAGGAVVTLRVRFLCDLAVELVAEVALGMGRLLELVVDRFVALFAAVIVQIIR
jgi:hypothetical protein